MHIEPGVVTGAKLVLSYATAASAGLLTVAAAVRHIRREGAASLAARSVIATLFAMAALAGRIVAPGTPYIRLRYGQALALSVAYEGGVVVWVGFWALYGHGLAAANLSGIAAFGASYVLLLAVEPLVDLAVLGVAKAWRGPGYPGLIAPRVIAVAAR